MACVCHVMRKCIPFPIVWRLCMVHKRNINQHTPVNVCAEWHLLCLSASLSLSLYLSVSLSFCLSICLSVCLSVCLFVCLSVYFVCFWFLIACVRYTVRKCMITIIWIHIHIFIHTHTLFPTHHPCSMTILIQRYTYSILSLFYGLSIFNGCRFVCVTHTHIGGKNCNWRMQRAAELRFSLFNGIPYSMAFCIQHYSYSLPRSGGDLT